MLPLMFYSHKIFSFSGQNSYISSNSGQINEKNNRFLRPKVKIYPQ